MQTVFYKKKLKHKGRYIIMKIKMTNLLKDVLITEIETVSDHIPICPILLGEPGIGKSSIVKSMCDERGWHYFELLCNQLGDRSDLTGCRTVKEKVTDSNGNEKEIWKQIFFPHQAIQDAIACAEQHPQDIIVLFLDEINRTSSDITSAILSFTTARKIGSYTFPDNVKFIVAGNDKGNITALDSASISRFCKYEIKPDAQLWMDYTKSVDTLNPYIETTLKSNPDLIFCKNINVTISGDDDEQSAEYETFDDSVEGFDQITTPRTLSGLNAFLNTCDIDSLSSLIGETEKDDSGEEENMLQTLIYAHVGKTQFALNLCETISQDILAGQMRKATAVSKPKMPKSYKAINRVTDRQTRDDMIANMTDDEMSEILLYAMCVKDHDNSDLITAIAKHYKQPLLTGNYQPQFANLKNHDELDADNYAALLNSGTMLGDMTRRILGD